MLAMGRVFWRRGFSECDLTWRKMKSGKALTMTLRDLDRN